ncbi:MAG: hypothetical protein PHT38_00295 [Halothiobacillus sp.]|nr:hypothetical protein [Halothiobacillus sp.]MDY0146527.1 hypothetical protein [Halothiobacillus sp.]
MNSNDQKEKKNAGTIFGLKISSTPAEDAREAKEALTKEQPIETEGAESEMPIDANEKESTPNTVEASDKKTSINTSNKTNGQLLVAGRRPAKGLNSSTILIDKDVEELLQAVIHPSSNKAMAMNELLRMSLKEIYSRKGELIIK